MINVMLEDRILEIVIDRPDAKNALTVDMYDRLTEAFERARGDDDVRVVILRGEGRVFTAGNDLGDFIQNPPSGEDSPVFKFLRAVIEFPKPLIAAVDGWAVGVGTTVLFHCDLVYASDRAKFKMPFVDLAVVPEAGSSLILPRMIGHQKAAELLFFSETFDAGQAAGFGIVNDVFSSAELLEQVRARAARLVTKAPESLRQTKALLKACQSKSLDETMAAEAELFIARLASDEFKEAVSAFFDKRAPEF